MARSCHGYDLVLRRYLLALHHLLDYVRFVAAIVLDRLGVVSFEGEMLPDQEPWSEPVDTAPMERLMEAAFWASSSPPKTNLSSSLTAPKHRPRLVAPAEVEGAEDDYRSAGMCAICLAGLDVGGQLVTELCNCSHAFHTACIDPWIDAGEVGTCPLCRTPTLSTAWWNGWREVVPRASLSP